jgi:hypothetical protein
MSDEETIVVLSSDEQALASWLADRIMAESRRLQAEVPGFRRRHAETVSIARLSALVTAKLGQTRAAEVLNAAIQIAGI